MAQGEEEIRVPGGGGPGPTPDPEFNIVVYCGDLSADPSLTQVPIGPNAVQQPLPPNPILVDVGDFVYGQGYVYTSSVFGYEESIDPNVISPQGGCRRPISQPTPEQTYIRYNPCSECGDQPFTSNTPTNGLDLDGQTVSFPDGNTPTCCFTALLVVGEPGSPLDVTFDWDNNPPQIITYND